MQFSFAGYVVAVTRSRPSTANGIAMDDGDGSSARRRAEIQAVLDRDGWILSLAVDAYRNELPHYGGFNDWWRCGGANWTRTIRGKLPWITRDELKRHLLEFARNHRHQAGDEVHRDAAARAGLPAPMVACADGMLRPIGPDRPVAENHDPS